MPSWARQGDRVRRLVRLAGIIAPWVGADDGLAERAALLAKADLTTGMVGEFPELQGVWAAITPCMTANCAT